ncbi:MAG: dephospho-CoA kinase [Oscillospiraceae bacterium]|jgi:dephospho-CoA kinase|nr:dephospho-CoA kinase [Oscillospiraceae bacterium]
MFPQIPVPVLGLAGPSGAGKSTAAAILAGQGCFVIDGDALARDIIRPGSPALAELAACFGEEILGPGGALNRPALAKKAFSSEENRQMLNKITHPYITKLAMESAGHAPPGSRAIVIDAAALHESELARYCDRILFFQADEELRLHRIMSRDQLTREAALLRLNAQKSPNFAPAAAFRRIPPAAAGYTIINCNESEAALRHELNKIMERI